jgi:MerR family redox-sensitive transcriptional activator SoxR
VPLAEIGEQLEGLPDGRPAGKADWARMSSRWRDRLDRRITLMTRLRDELTGCIGCGCLSLKTCPLYNREDRLSDEGSGPRRLMRRGRDVFVPE